MFDPEFTKNLMRIAYAANPPEEMDDAFTDVEFASTDGWKVWIFYDCGELDYIDHFVSPSGEKVELWGDEIDPRVDDRIIEEGIFATIQNWRSVTDTERLIAYIDEQQATPKAKV